MKRNDKKVLNIHSNKRKRRLKKRHILLLVIFAYLLVFFTYQTFQIITLKKQERLQSEKLEQLEKTKAEYQQQLEQVNSAEYIEKIARKNLRMIKPGELLYVDEDYDDKDDDETMNEEVSEDKE